MKAEVKSRIKLYLKIIVLVFAFVNAVNAINYFRSPQFVSKLTDFMLDKPVKNIETPMLTWCQADSNSQIIFKNKKTISKKFCKLPIESYDSKELVNAKFESKIEERQDHQVQDVIEADLSRGLFRYRDIIFKSQNLLESLKKF